MAVGKRDPRGPIVVAGWIINNPRLSWAFHHHVSKAPSIDPIRVLIDHVPSTWRATG